MGPQIQWLHSHVTENKLCCVYLALTRAPPVSPCAARVFPPIASQPCADGMGSYVPMDMNTIPARRVSRSNSPCKFVLYWHVAGEANMINALAQKRLPLPGALRGLHPQIRR